MEELVADGGGQVAPLLGVGVDLAAGVTLAGLDVRVDLPLRSEVAMTIGLALGEKRHGALEQR